MKTKLTDKDASYILIIALIAMSVFGMAVLLVEGVLSTYLSFLIPQIVYIFTAFLYYFFKKESLGFALRVNKNSSSTSYPTVVLLAVSIYCTFLIVGVVFDWLLDFLQLSVNITIPDVSNPIHLVLSLMIICVLPAIGEELIFRGVLLSIFEKKSDRFAVIMSALTFALSHLNLSQFVYQFIFGIFLAFVVVKTKNILFASIIHFMNNALVLVLPLIFKNYESLGIMTPINVGYLAIISVCGIALLIPSLMAVVRLGSRDKSNSANIFKFLIKKSDTVCYNDQQRYTTSSLFIGVLITFLLLGIFNSILL